VGVDELRQEANLGGVSSDDLGHEQSQFSVELVLARLWSSGVDDFDGETSQVLDGDISSEVLDSVVDGLHSG